MPTIPSFKDMPIWQRAVRLSVDVINIAASLPAESAASLGGELQRLSIDIPALLASGSKSGKHGFQTSLLRARQSAAELETLLLILQQAYPSLPIDDTVLEAGDIQASLTAMARRLSGSSHEQTPKSL